MNLPTSTRALRAIAQSGTDRELVAAAVGELLRREGGEASAPTPVPAVASAPKRAAPKNAPKKKGKR